MPNTVMITIPLRELERLFGVRRITTAEPDEDARGDLIQLSDADESFKVTLTRNNMRAYYDGPLPEEKMRPVIADRNLMVTFG
jgi:hypothetical protein